MTLMCVKGGAEIHVFFWHDTAMTFQSHLSGAHASQGNPIHGLADVRRHKIHYEVLAEYYEYNGEEITQWSTSSESTFVSSTVGQYRSTGVEVLTIALGSCNWVFHHTVL